MELPFTIVFEPPSQAELRTVVRMRGAWVAGLTLALAIGTIGLLWHVGRADAGLNATQVALDIRSQPAGVGLWLDGRERGRTPQVFQVDGGGHSVVLKPRDGLELQYSVQAVGDSTLFEAVPWRRQPLLMRLRPVLPGASLADVRLLADGRLALVLLLPVEHQLQAWRLDPHTGGLEAVLSASAGSRAVVAPDGQHVAYLGYDVGPPPSPSGLNGARRSDVLWLTTEGAVQPAVGWGAPLADEETLVDASWSQLADRLLVVAAQSQAGGAVRSRLWFVERAEPHPHPRQVLELPSGIVAGSEMWSPDGQRVAFLAHAGGVNALCLLELDGSFRYLADLDPSAGPPLPYPAAVFSADSKQLLFVAPQQRPPAASGGWLLPQARQSVYVADGAGTAPRVIGDADVDFATWREDGQLLGLRRQGSGGWLELGLLPAGASAAQHLVDLPLKAAAGYGAAWDLARAQLLLANPSPAGGAEYWLAVLGLEAEV